MALLQFENVSFAYPNATRRALDQISFTIHEGEYAVLCGPSGCGKTTLLRQAKRELAPVGAFEGRIFCNGAELSDKTPADDLCTVGFVQQYPDDQIVTDFVWHELAFGLEDLALPTQVIRRRVAEMASFFGMESWFRKKTCELSGGQKQLLNLASVMAMDPKLLIMDEPTSQLDPLASQSLLDTVKRINRELGVAVLITEHRLDQVFPASDRVLLMEDGRMRYDGPPQEIASKLAKAGSRERLYYGLPAPVRICGELGDDPVPLTVREARASLKQKLGEPTQGPPAYPGARKEPERKPVLQGKELWFRYKQDQPDILRGTELSLFPSETLCLLGGNGAGKTTLLKALTGVVTPQRGKVKTKKGCRLAMLPQAPQALFTQDLLRREFLEAGNAEEMMLWAEKLELTGLLDRHPFDLSGGELERAAICKLLLRNANVLLLDEPTKGLDAYAKRSLAILLHSLNDAGVSILAVTHDVDFAAEWADRCAMMFDGRIISADTPQVFFAGNRFYTTDANRIASGWFSDAVTSEDVVARTKEALLR